MACPPLQITFLGTGTSSGVPMIGCSCEVCTSEDPKDNRLRSSILVESATTRFVVDTTPDFRYQMLRGKVNHLDAILFTHPHKDHVAGLDDVRAYNFFQHKPMQIYANEMTIAALKREFAYAFSDKKYPGVPDLQLNEIDLEPFQIGDITVTPIKVWHLHMPVYGFRFGSFTYITDANRIDNAELDKLAGTETIVLNALRKRKHISHYTLDEAIEIAQALKTKQAYFTHLSHQMGRHAKVQAELPEGFDLAYDGLVIKVNESD